jgi:transglutaminase/protease-like cytokinesis protein 3
MKKRILTILICLILIGATAFYLDKITSKLASYFNSTPKVSIEKKNQYAKEKDYKYVQTTDTFIPYNYQDLLNVLYTILDAGYDNFTFYCPIEYQDCINDIKQISNTEKNEVLTTIGNYVHPYNNFSTIRIEYDTAGEVTVYVTHLYSDEEIDKVSNEINRIWTSLVSEGMTNKEILYAFHDYIINHTKYDEKYETELDTLGKTTYHSDKAIGPLFEGYAICSGYTDTMSIVLDRLGIDNYKVASNTHVWNALNLDDTWLHLDLTWDDPVSEDRSKNNLLHKFFLVDTNTLESFDIEEHTFDKSIYRELK